MSARAAGKATDTDAERLFSVLLATQPSGQPKFSEEEILTFLPLLMKSAGLSLDGSWSARAVFDRVAQIVGAAAQDSDEVLTKKLEDYYRAHPPSAALQDAFAVFCRAEAGVATADSFQGFVSRVRTGESAAHVPTTRSVFDVHDPKDSSKEPK